MNKDIVSLFQELERLIKELPNNLERAQALNNLSDAKRRVLASKRRG